MKVLIVRFSSIGDIVLTTPVVRGLSQQLGAEVHFLTKSSYKAILEPNPYISKIFALNGRLGELLPQLRSEKYDAIIDLHSNLRSWRVKWALRRPTHTFDKLNWQKWLLVNLKINRLPDQHIVDRYLAAAAPLGVVNDGQGLDYFVPEEEEVAMGNFLTGNVMGTPIGGTPMTTPAYVAFAIGAAHETKRLPTQKIIAICQALAPRPVLLLGGPAESEEGQAIADAAGGHVHNTCGKFSLHQSASVVRQAAVVLTHDTGMMHIAAAFRKRIVSVWGNTVPDFGMYPYYPFGQDDNTTVEVAGLSCRPCSKIGHAQCPKGHFRCMQEISVEGVVEAV